MNRLASKILMVRPNRFGFNPQTAESNAFQKPSKLNQEEVSKRARHEFDRMTNRLRKIGVDLVVIEESRVDHTPDSVFPNNVFSTHDDGILCIYPMEAAARRLERSIVKEVRSHFAVSRVVDLTGREGEGKYLEGTGSLVLDHKNQVAFACLSSRTDLLVLEEWCSELDFEAFVFEAKDRSGKEIYHTNVMLCLGDGFAVACTESIHDSLVKKRFRQKIADTGHELIDISYEQMYSFAGNMLQIRAIDGRKILLMSECAFESLSPAQTERLETYSELEHFRIETIEECGGGSVRCMIAEIF